MEELNFDGFEPKELIPSSYEYEATEEFIEVSSNTIIRTIIVYL